MTSYSLAQALLASLPGDWLVTNLETITER